MDLKQLSYFTAIVREGSYSRAAEKLNVSQPALSVAIKKLENELGVKLFYSFDRRQWLTDEGIRLMNGAVQMLDVYRKTVENVMADNAETTGSLLMFMFWTAIIGTIKENLARDQEGWAVVVADLNLAGAEAVAKELTDAGLTALAVRMDVADEQEVEAGFDRMMEQFGSCDLVMSNAGVQIVHPFDEYPFEGWKKMVAIHADGAFLVSRAAFRRMKASGKGGRIVFTGSVQSFVGSKLKEPYNFAKHGVAGLAKAVAREGAEYGIYTYTICPSFIKTPLVEKQIPEQARDLGISEEKVVKNIMLRDTVDDVFTTVEDVANTLYFLSNDQGALTGQSLRLTHGWAMA